jgi:hypothetical protein
MKHVLLNKASAINKVAYVSHVPGHTNSKGESAPWVVKQHNTDKILESFKSESAAKEGLKNMESHKGSVKKRSFGYYNFSWQGNDALLCGPNGDTILLSGKSAREFQDELEHIEEVTPSSEALEQAVNEYISGYFSDQQEPTEEEVAHA